MLHALAAQNLPQLRNRACRGGARKAATQANGSD